MRLGDFEARRCLIVIELAEITRLTVHKYRPASAHANERPMSVRLWREAKARSR